MHRSTPLFALALLVTTTGADAQLAGLFGKALGMPAKGVVGGTYQSHDQVRTFVMLDPAQQNDAYAMLIARAAVMAQAKSFARIGVTKANCMAALVSGTARSTSCYVIATMLRDQADARPRGDRPVQYYRVADLAR